MQAENRWGVSVCAEPMTDDRDDEDTAADAKARSRTPVGLGSLMTLDRLPTAIPGKGVTIKYEDGQLCEHGPPNTRWKTELHVVCNLSALVGRPQPAGPHPSGVCVYACACACVYVCMCVAVRMLMRAAIAVPYHLSTYLCITHVCVHLRMYVPSAHAPARTRTQDTRKHADATKPMCMFMRVDTPCQHVCARCMSLITRACAGPPCTLHLIWASQHGCPLCRLSDYR